MTIPQTIEANSPPAVISSVSLAGLESVLSSSSLRFHRDEPKRFGNSSPSTEGPIAKPTRKRSTDALTLLDSYFNEPTHNASFDDDQRSEFKAPKSARLEMVMSSDASYSSSTSCRSSRSSTQDHLMERYLKLVEDAKLKSKSTAPQMPKRKASFGRRASSIMPLSMPVRKASLHDMSRRGSV